jgi:phosphoribosylglycinamide formyltransferase-1
MFQLGLLASHRGSNVRAVIEACRDGRLRSRPAVVISNNGDAEVLATARAAGVPAVHVGGPAVADPAVRDRAILSALRDHGADLVLLLGYLRLLGLETLAAYAGRTLNTHPALLPRHGGQGLYGVRVHQAVLAAGDRETGVTLHHVTARYDEGAAIAQCRVPVLPGDTPGALAARVLAREHGFLVESLAALEAGYLRLDPGG